MQQNLVQSLQIIKLQSYVRKKIAQSKYKVNIQRFRTGLSKLQSILRGKKKRKLFLCLKEAVIKFQNIWRLKRKKLEFESFKSSIYQKSETFWKCSQLNNEVVCSLLLSIPTFANYTDIDVIRYDTIAGFLNDRNIFFENKVDNDKICVYRGYTYIVKDLDQPILSRVMTILWNVNDSLVVECMDELSYYLLEKKYT